MPAELEQTIARALEETLRPKAEALVKETADELRTQLAEAVDAAVRTESSRAAIESSSSLAETLHEAVRRIRSESSVTGIAAALVDGAARHCGRAALLIHKEDRMLGFRAAGTEPQVADDFSRLGFRAADAAAVSHALSSLDSTVTRGAAGDLSADLVEVFGLSDEDSVSLFPIVLRERALALLYCDGHGGESVGTAAIEVLVAMAEAWIEAVSTRRKHTSTAA